MHRIAVLATVLLLPLSACGAGGDDGAAPGQPTVLTSFYPLQFVAERIAGEHAVVESLAAPGVEPHDLELSVRQVADLGNADLVFYEAGLQPAVDDALDNVDAEHTLDVAGVVELAHADEHDADEEHADEDSEDDHGHEGLDPHFWLDPTLLAESADAFAEKISDIDPDHASDYAAANTTLQQQLTELDSEFQAGLATCRTRAIVVSHDAFGYLGARYDLEILPIAGLSPDAEPSPKHLGELADLIQEKGITTVFNERLASPALSRTLADELGLRTAVLDPIEGLASEDGDDDYLSLMRENLSSIREADSCK